MVMTAKIVALNMQVHVNKSPPLLTNDIAKELILIYLFFALSNDERVGANFGGFSPTNFFSSVNKIESMFSLKIRS